FESFEEDVQRAITRLVAGSSPSPLAAPQLVEPALVELRSWPAGDPGYALGRVWDAVTSEKRHFPRGVPAISDCSYSDRPLTNLWGFFRYADRKLVISSTLNSPDVPRFVVEFLMYHEALHADMPNSGHNAEFRQRERRFIPSAEAVEDAKQRNFAPGAGAESWRALADQFLDTFPRRFSVGSAQSKLNY
ncbi:MAG TPA: hypothetical protein PLV92_16245, partial [Pirellulaceae bacterium]|nr:hypothetical protein [Pirellulaceae bacterium]